MRPNSYFRYFCAGLESPNCGLWRARGVRLAQVLLLTISALFYLDPNLVAQTPDSQTGKEANQSWTAVTDVKSDNVTPGRIIESHSQKGNRTLDKRSLQIPGYAGDFELYEDTETETLQVDTNTERITTHTFARDGNGMRTLVGVTEEESHTAPGGDSKIVRLTSTSDVNGRLQPVRREIVETKSIGMETEETDSTVMLASINGGFAPAVKTHELLKRGVNDTLESEKTVLLLDGAGNWQVSELRQRSTRVEGKNQSTEEHVSRRDAEGHLVEVSRFLSTQSEISPGEKQSFVETYSTDVPGAPRDGALHLVERTTTTQRTAAAGEQIAQHRVEQANPGDPNSALRLSVLINDTVRPGPSGLLATRTVRLRDANGIFRVVEVDTTNSDNVLTINLQGMPSQKPK